MGKAINNQELGFAVIDTMNCGVVLLDKSLRILFWNGWMAKHSYRAADEVVGRQLEEFLEENATLLRRARDAATSRLTSIMSHNLNPSPLPLYSNRIEERGARRMGQGISVLPIQHGSENYVLLQVFSADSVLARDQVRKKEQEALRNQLHVDALTGVGNRKMLDERMVTDFSRAKRAKAPISVIMIDIDCFKGYNDHYGHLRGDDCLKQVAGAIKSCVVRDDDLAARFGGEEFCVILPNTPIVGAQMVAERIRKTVEDLGIRHEMSTVCPSVTISLGVATVTPEVDMPSSALLEIADEALYEAKRRRNQVVCKDLDSPSSSASTQA